MNDNISDKDKKDWQSFVLSKDKLPNKDFKPRKKNILKVGAISDENFIYRFILITNKNEFDTFSESFKRILNSFKKVSTNKQLSDLSPPKIRILRNSQNNNFLTSIREKISLQKKYSIEIFKIINDYENKPEEKRKIKSIY